MEITVTLHVADDDTLHIVYNGKADADTIKPYESHSYFNLNGHEREALKDRYCRFSQMPIRQSIRLGDAIPTGDCIGGGTPMDFRTEKQIGQDIRADF